MSQIDVYRDNVRRAVKAARLYLRLHGKEPPGDALKTEAYYQRSLDRAVRDFYAGEIDEGEFIDEMIRLIEGQFGRAWNEGSRAVGVDPKDHTEEDDSLLQEKVDAELDHVLDFASAIDNAAANGEPVGPLRDRVSLWTNRYNEIMNDAKLHFGGSINLAWRLGETEDHCSTCYTLDGIVASAEEWEASGLHPQGAPNERLECGGWRCDCRLEPTKEPKTEGGIPNV